MNFNGWSKLNAYNEACENPIYCKAQLSRMGLKPSSDAVPERHSVRIDSHWHDFDFYTLDKTVEKRQVTRIVTDLDATPENLCAALYVINKSAKVSRDSAQTKYEDRDFTQASRAKARKDELYQLKNRAMCKLIAEGILELAGYNEQETQRRKTVFKSGCDSCEYNHIPHSQECEFCDVHGEYEEVEETHTSYLLLYRCGTYSFHAPCNKKPTDVSFIGDIDRLISKTVTRDTPVKFTDAVRLLKKYCGEAT